MNLIENQQEFTEWISSSDFEFEKQQFERNNYRPKSEMVYLDKLILTNLTIRNKHFESTEFKNCKFINCDFTNSIFASCILENTLFEGCTFTWSKFLDVDLFSCQFERCTILGLELSDAVLRESSFVNCSEVLDLAIRGSRERIVSFTNCYLHHLDMEPINENEKEQIEFIDCMIKESSFDRIDFSKSCFNNCSLSLNQFSSCTYSQNTFIDRNQTPGKEYNLIDIRTILNSPPIEIDTLANLFGIHNHDVKEYLIGVTSKIEFQSIFISYSFQDKDFAQLINNELIRRGILTFLWEKDSPGGKPLKEIMSQGVNEMDRILFIASKNSLKSSACHFELTEGRKKQERNWDDVLFPIHIDNFLFDVKKNQIRPIEFQDEYWKNIAELRLLNSLPFEEFIDKSNRDEVLFEKQIMRLIKGIRK